MMKWCNFKILLTLLVCFIIISGCKKSNLEDLIDVTSIQEEMILNYLDENIAETNRGEVVSSYRVLGTGENEIYLYVFHGVYNTSNNEVLSAGYDSVVVYLDKSNTEIIKYKIPDDGVNYGKSKMKLFPEDIIKSISEYEGNQQSNSQLEKESEQRMNDINPI